MEGKGPYRIYDPGGATQEEAAKAFERLVEENTRLKEKMQGIKSLGNGSASAAPRSLSQGRPCICRSCRAVQELS